MTTQVSKISPLGLPGSTPAVSDQRGVRGRLLLSQHDAEVNKVFIAGLTKKASPALISMESSLHRMTGLLERGQKK